MPLPPPLQGEKMARKYTPENILTSLMVKIIGKLLACYLMSIY
jgi:hypothetical protein